MTTEGVVMEIAARYVRKGMLHTTVFACVVLVVGVSVTACSSAVGTQGGQSQAQSGSKAIAKQETLTPNAAIMEKAYGASTTDGIDPVDLATLTRAEKPVDESTLNVAMKCYKDNVCDTGHGTLTVALADGFGENAWRQVTHMEFILQALSYP